MKKKYIIETCKLLGIEVGDPFDILTEDGSSLKLNPYHFTNESLIDNEGGACHDSIIGGFAVGEAYRRGQ